MSRFTQLSLLIGAGLLSGVVVLVIAIDRHRSLPENIIVHPLGEGIRYDDFTFAVLGSREAPELAASRSGRFVVVTFRVSNDARRVEHRFKPSRIRLVTGQGAEFGVSDAGTAALRETRADGCAGALAPGTTCVTELAFELPPGATGLRARVGTDFGLFDMIDRIVHGKQFLDLN